jgi:excisionase family DNA binding protein
VARIETGNEPPGVRWYFVNEVASYHGAATDTIYRWIERKKLDAWVRSGGADETRETGKG